ncbi:MAG TPA: GntR family transcriptional regulator [Devosia sp.]|nr:GntR family transcriptional regulator [Devosia sp.]
MRWSAVYLGLRDAILTHALGPGTKLPEDELGEVYSVSRTIVRSALQSLAHDRLVTLEPNRGAFVAKPTKIEAREVFEARALIEPKVAGLAAEVARPADVALLRRHLEEEHDAMHAGRDGEAVVLSGRFHVAIAEIAGQSILTDFVRGLCSRSSLIIALYWHRRDAICESHAHLALVEAIGKNSPRDATELMTSHLVDLLSGLDLTDHPAATTRLVDILRPTLHSKAAPSLRRHSLDASVAARLPPKE